MNIREGDSIFAKDASAVYIVDETDDYNEVKVHDRDRPNRKRTIKTCKLEHIDADVWQECE